MAKARIKVPDKVFSGEVFTVKTLISHRMESGHRVDDEGNSIPQMIINSFTCEYNGTPVFSCDMGTAIAANPYFEFKAKVEEAGSFKFTWVDDEDEVTVAEAEITLA